MVSHLFYYQLALLVLVWLFVMLHVAESHRGAPIPPTATPIKPKSKRSNEPKPFHGLTHKPHCALCARETAHPQAPPPVPPDPMAPTHRRPREVDTSRHFCPHNDCDYRGWLGRGNLRANGHPSGGPWRQFHCTSCDGYFLETHGTIFHGKQAAVELIVRVLACLAEGLGYPRHGAGLRGRRQHGVAVVGRSGRAAARLFRLFPVRPPPGAVATRRVVRGAARPQSRRDQ